MKRYSVLICTIALLSLVISSCTKTTYQGSVLKKKEIKQLSESQSFNINQAKMIIRHNEKMKRKREKYADKHRKNEQEYLEALNKTSSKTAKIKKVRTPLVVDFY
jgi:hypothetical protein